MFHLSINFVSDISPESTGVFFSGETFEKEETSLFALYLKLLCNNSHSGSEVILLCTVLYVCVSVCHISLTVTYVFTHFQGNQPQDVLYVTVILTELKGAYRQIMRNTKNRFV